MSYLACIYRFAAFAVHAADNPENRQPLSQELRRMRPSLRSISRPPFPMPTSSVSSL